MRFKSWLQSPDRHETVLTLKDEPAAPKSPDQSQNWDEVRRRLMEAARKVDPTYTIGEQEALVARLIQDMMCQTATPRSMNEYLMGIKNADVAKVQAAYSERVARAAGQESQAVPFSKRIKPDYAKVY